jgi:2-C-methyl-D-erythritol 2,4-cyclodiphosphate synthase|tara:strand:- start:62 stop:580 length:519 start_codon:yes stop_codon:yes gene_type:complete
MTEQENFVRSGIGIDIHKFSNKKLENNFIKIGGIDIDFPRKIIAHSDGDVVIHAIIDALLGAMAKGDIGEYFPDNDLKWKDVDSSLMLLEIKRLLTKNYYKIVNIDLTIICEEPKISNHKVKIKEKLTKILEIDLDQINIKATTCEKMGFLGRREGICCQAICNIISKSAPK